MKKERQNLIALLIVKLVLLGAHLAQDHGVDDLEMRGVRGQRQVHAVVVELAVGGSAEVIFHIARALDLVGMGATSPELVEDGAEGLGHDVGQHVEAPAMGHADDDLFHAELTAAFDDLLERGHHRLPAIESEALGAGVFHVEEALEDLRLDQLLEDRLPPALGERHIAAFDAVLNPRSLLGVGDVHVLDPDRAAIGAPYNVEHLAQGAEFEP